MAEFLVYLVIFLYGLVIGSFLNVLIYRIPKGEEFVVTRSHCMSCGHQLAWKDNIPLFSWLVLGGKCRYCKAKISPQYPIIEGGNAIMWVIISLVRGFHISTFVICMICSLLLALSVIDWRTFEIADGFHIAIGVGGLILTLLDLKNWVGHLIGALCVSLVLLIIFVVSNGRAIGGGDVKLMAVCGLALGWKAVIVAFIIGVISAAIIHPIRMKIAGADRMLAFGPYLSAGVFLAFLFGERLADWYIGFL